MYDLEQDPEESDNLYGSFPDIAEKMRALLIRYVKEGRSTPGIPQKNDDPEVWEQLNWME